MESSFLKTGFLLSKSFRFWTLFLRQASFSELLDLILISGKSHNARQTDITPSANWSLGLSGVVQQGKENYWVLVTQNYSETGDFQENNLPNVSLLWRKFSVSALCSTFFCLGHWLIRALRIIHRIFQDCKIYGSPRFHCLCSIINFFSALITRLQSSLVRSIHPHPLQVFHFSSLMVFKTSLMAFKVETFSTAEPITTIPQLSLRVSFTRKTRFPICNEFQCVFVSPLHQLVQPIVKIQPPH